MALGEVADLRAGLGGRFAEDGTEPDSSGISPRIARMSVDLPAPLGPSTATNSPASDGELDVAEDSLARRAGPMRP